MRILASILALVVLAAIIPSGNPTNTTNAVRAEVPSYVVFLPSMYGRPFTLEPATCDYEGMQTVFVPLPPGESLTVWTYVIAKDRVVTGYLGSTHGYDPDQRFTLAIEHLAHEIPGRIDWNNQWGPADSIRFATQVPYEDQYYMRATNVSDNIRNVEFAWAICDRPLDW